MSVAQDVPRGDEGLGRADRDSRRRIQSHPAGIQQRMIGVNRNSRTCRKIRTSISYCPEACRRGLRVRAASNGAAMLAQPPATFRQLRVRSGEYRGSNQQKAEPDQQKCRGEAPHLNLFYSRPKKFHAGCRFRPPPFVIPVQNAKQKGG